MNPRKRYAKVLIWLVPLLALSVVAVIAYSYISIANGQVKTVSAAVNVEDRNIEETNKANEIAAQRSGGTPPPSLTPKPSPPALTPANPPTPTPEPVYTAALSFTGDIMLHSWQYNADYNAATGVYGFDREFEHVKAYLSTRDFVAGNLETTLAGAFSDYPMFSAPDAFGQAVKNAGFSFVSTANNHCNDKRTDGILRTLDKLDEIGLAHAGTYRSQKEREKTYIADVNGIKFAILSYSYSTNGIPVQNGMPFLVNLLDKELIKEQIDRAKAESPDVIIVMPHMGTEYALEPSAEARNWAEYMLECGADVVIASHPHVIQRVDVSEKGIIAWSMGNFISSQRDVPRDYSMILNLEFEKTGTGKAVCKKVSFVPTWVKFMNNLGLYDVRVVPVFDALNDYNGENALLLRPKDYNRLAEVNREITRKLTGEEREPKFEYTLFEK